MLILSILSAYILASNLLVVSLLVVQQKNKIAMVDKISW